MTAADRRCKNGGDCCQCAQHKNKTGLYREKTQKFESRQDREQDSNTNKTHYNMAELVSWWSHMTLEPGDVITTGSPPGVISGMKEPVWMKSGDVMECRVEKLGCLVTKVA